MNQSNSNDSYVSGASYGGQRLGSNHSVTFTDKNGNNLNNASGRSGSFANGQMTGGFANGQGGFPAGDFPAGEFPSGEFPGAPQGNGSDNAGGAQPQASGGNGRTGTGSGNYANFAAGANGFSASRFQSSGQTMNITIPVGTTVLTTSNGTLTTTTFGKILANDIIQIIVQTDAAGGHTVLAAQIMG